MVFRSLAIAALMGFIAASTAASLTLPPGPPLSGAQILEKNIAARGGLEAWRRIDTMVWMGHVERARANEPALPFVLQLQHPNKTRFEITAATGQFVRMFDGTHGWRLRPGGSGAPDFKPFSAEEENYSRDEFVIGGPLIDHEAKGVAVKLAGLDQIEGRKAYLLELKLPSGAERRVWIDAETFLEIRSDRPSSSPFSKGAALSMYYSNYRSIDGLQIPLTLETRTTTTNQAEKLIIDRVALNPKLSAQVFARPPVPMHRNALVRAVPDPEPAAAEPTPPSP